MNISEGKYIAVDVEGRHNESCPAVCLLGKYVFSIFRLLCFRTAFLLFASFLLMISCIDRDAQGLYWYEEGLNYEAQNEPALALEAYLKATDYLKSSPDRTFYAKVCNQLSSIFFEHGYYERSMTASKRVLNESENLSDKTELSRAYRGIGKICYVKGDWTQALHYLLQAQELEVQVEDVEEVASIYNNLSNTYCEMGEYQKALACNTKALFLTKDSLKRYRNRSVRGRIYTHLCQYDSAFYYILWASHSSDVRVRASSYYKLSDMPVESGITDSMKYEYLSKAEVLSDSIENARHSGLVLEGEHQHRLNDLKQKEVTKLGIIVGTVITLVIIALLYSYWRFRRKTVKYEQLIAELTDGHRELSKMYEQDSAERVRMVVSLINNLGEACADKFKSQSAYEDLLRLLKQERMLNYEEQEKLLHDTNLFFDSYIKQLRVVTDGRLSGNDLFLCCLLLLKLTTKACAFCRGVSNETIRSQRTRIKKKIPQNLFDAGLMKGCFGDD